MSIERNYLNQQKDYSVEKLWKAVEGKPNKNIQINAFNSSLNLKIWMNKSGNLVSPIDVLKNNKIAPREIKKIKKSNLNYPIIVSESNLDVLDGLHRLCKSIMLGNIEIKVQKVSIYDLRQQFKRTLRDKSRKVKHKNKSKNIL